MNHTKSLPIILNHSAANQQPVPNEKWRSFTDHPPHIHSRTHMYGMTTERGFLEEKKFKIKSRGASVSIDVLKRSDPLSLGLVTEQIKHGQIWGLVLPPRDDVSEDMTLSKPINTSLVRQHSWRDCYCWERDARDLQLKSEVYIHLSQIHLNSVVHNSWHVILVTKLS